MIISVALHSWWSLDWHSVLLVFQWAETCFSYRVSVVWDLHLTQSIHTKSRLWEHHTSLRIAAKCVQSQCNDGQEGTHILSVWNLKTHTQIDLTFSWTFDFSNSNWKGRIKHCSASDGFACRFMYNKQCRDHSLLTGERFRSVSQV